MKPVTLPRSPKLCSERLREINAACAVQRRANERSHRWADLLIAAVCVGTIATVAVLSIPGL